MPNSIILENISAYEDICEIARLHLVGLSEGFLSSLGHGFLTLLYQAMVESDEAVVLCAKDGERPVGFIAGCTNLDEFYKEFRKKYKWKAFRILFKRSFSFDFIRKILQTNSYADKSRHLPDAELLSIVVLEEYWGSGISGQLLQKFCGELVAKGVKELKVIVWAKNIRANKYYEKQGFVLAETMELVNGQNSNVYVRKLS